MALFRNIKAWLILRYFDTEHILAAYDLLDRANPDNAALMAEKHRGMWVMMRELNRRGASIKSNFYGA